MIFALFYLLFVLAIYKIDDLCYTYLGFKNRLVPINVGNSMPLSKYKKSLNILELIFCHYCGYFKKSGQIKYDRNNKTRIIKL